FLRPGGQALQFVLQLGLFPLGEVGALAQRSQGLIQRRLGPLDGSLRAQVLVALLQPVGERLLRIRRQAELLEDAGTLPVQPLDLRPDDLLQVAPGSVPLLANLAQPLDTVNEVIDVTLRALLVSRRRITGADEVSIERRQQ